MVEVAPQNGCHVEDNLPHDHSQFYLPLRSLAFVTLTARAEQVVFSEIMYNPPAGKPEFVEIWNITNTPLDMAKWHFLRRSHFSPFPISIRPVPRRIF
jgi:hypothetical protein